MTDIAIEISELGADLVIEGDDLKLEQGLETAVIISLFSDKRVSRQLLPEGASGQRGWWGDVLSDIESDEIGSHFWIINRETVSYEVLNRLEEFVFRALEWMIDGGLAERIEVTSTRRDLEIIDISVSISRLETEDLRFDFAWEGQKLKRGLDAVS